MLLITMPPRRLHVTLRLRAELCAFARSRCEAALWLNTFEQPFVPPDEPILIHDELSLKPVMDAKIDVGKGRLTETQVLLP
jgi:hypothetical protein